MIPAETWYKTHNGELLVFVEMINIHQHYLEGCKYEIFVLIDYDNFSQFMDMKNLSFCQVW